MREKIFISFSGGLTSAFMTKFIFDKYPNSEKVVLFANTGKEDNRTLDFVNDCSVNWGLNVVWVEYNPQKEWGKRNWFKIVDFETASRNGEPFERFIKKEGIPNVKNSGCSSRLKELPMHNYVKYFLGWSNYKTAIGIRWDEKHRINWGKARRENLIYPLVTDFPVSIEFIHNWWQQQSFSLKIKSYQGNCDCCWKKSKRKLLTIAKETPELFKWWAEMEQRYGEEQGYSFYRKNEFALDILEQAEHFPDSKKQKCDTIISKIKNSQKSILDEIDMESRCNCNF